jgi:hypothetical protein
MWQVWIYVYAMRNHHGKIIFFSAQGLSGVRNGDTVVVGSLRSGAGESLRAASLEVRNPWARWVMSNLEVYPKR